MSKMSELSADYPLHVHELAEAEANVGRLLHALKVAEDALSRSPFSTQMWPNGMHPNAGIELIREAIAKAAPDHPPFIPQDGNEP